MWVSAGGASLWDREQSQGAASGVAAWHSTRPGHLVAFFSFQSKMLLFFL